MSRPFHFKQFSIHQEHSPMKVGTDGALLGAWASHPSPARILDVGCGTGLISLMLAQRYPMAQVVGIEPHAGGYRDAQYNAAHSPFGESPAGHNPSISASRLTILHTALEAYQPEESFDLMVSNPPFFDKQLQAPDPGRSMARHVQGLSAEALMAAACKMLSAQGVLCFIYPATEGARIDAAIKELPLRVHTVCKVKPHPDKPVHRLMWRIERSPGMAASATWVPSEEQLTIETRQRHQYSPEVQALWSPFYLKL